MSEEQNSAMAATGIALAFESPLGELSHENQTASLPEKGMQMSSRELAVSIGRNSFFGMLARIAQVGSRLVTIPIVIAHLGLGGYGIWSIILTIATYMRFGSFGIKSAFQKYVAEATGNGDFESANKRLSTGSAGMLLLSVLLIPVALFAGTVARIAGVPPEFLGSAAKSIAILALIMFLSNLGAAYEAIVAGQLQFC